MIDFSKFEKSCGVIFKNKDLLRQAFTHRSYLNENPKSVLNHNERLEFLGDAVLELAVTDYLFRKYPGKPEGELTPIRSALVNTSVLSETAVRLRMNDFLLLSKGEAKDTGKARQYILANTFEALVGAIYLDKGLNSAQEFVAANLFGLLTEIVSKRLWKDVKSLVQEKAQEYLEVTPSYRVLTETGPDHDRNFRVGIYFGKDLIAEGDGQSKQEAEQEAAGKALQLKSWS